MTAVDPLVRFKKDLEDLVDNDKFKINDLTFFARDFKDIEGVAQGIVEITIRHVHKISASLKLLGLYVVDSIVKNVGIPFRKLYTSTIVDAFVHSFQTIRDEEGRLKLYNLRATWKDIFPNSKMYELDIRVREHDPAWPLLSTPPETKSAFRSLPNIPKIHVKSEIKDSVESAPNNETHVQKSTISASRDPRLNRKRKTSPETKPHITEDFLIDRAGDHKMEAVARKQGRQEETQTQSKKLPLFGGQDLDMRSMPSSQLPARSAAWSTYINKHSEVSSRRETKDVDMRIIGGIVSNSNIVCDSSSPFINTQPKATLPVLPEPINSRSTSRSVILSEINEYQQKLELSDRIKPAKVEVTSALSMNTIPNQLPPFFKANRVDNPDANCISEFPRPMMPMFQPYMNGPTTRQIHGPPVQGPVWNVEIDGFPDMINIGVDPRMLSLVSHPKQPRRIAIDGRQYSLLLDRVQPLVMIGDQVHAVRFRCDFANIVINDRCFTIPGTGFTKIFVGTRPYQAYLGGPGHELIIDGKPHTVPFGSQLTFINVNYNSVGVKFVGTHPRNVNILPVIPPRLLRWAGQGLFGSPRQLHKPPLNPLSELARLAGDRQMTRFKPCSYDAQPVDSQVIPQDTEEIKGNMTDGSDQQHGQSSTINTNIPSTSAPSGLSLTQPINVYELYQKLVKAGIVSDSSASCTEPKPPDLTSYSWERFKQPCVSEIEEIYKGHQCGQCGSRFQSDLSPEFASHLDYHYMKNIADGSDRRSRNFYQSARYWLLSEMTREGAPQFEPGTPVLDLQECKCPAFADPSKNVCAVCYEKFDVFWDHDEEEWMLRDAVLVQDRIYHPICQEDAGKEFTHTSPERSPVQSEAASLVQHAISESSGPVTAEPIPGLVTSPKNDNPAGGSEEDAFRSENLTEFCIPGLSPDSVKPFSPIPEVEKIKEEEETCLPISVIAKTEEPRNPVVTRDLVPTAVDTISADPLAALKAVLCGNVSSLLTPSSLP